MFMQFIAAAPAHAVWSRFDDSEKDMIAMIDESEVTESTPARSTSPVTSSHSGQEQDPFQFQDDSQHGSGNIDDSALDCSK